MATLETHLDNIIQAAIDGYPVTDTDTDTVPNEIEFAFVGYKNTEPPQFDSDWNMGIGMFGSLLKGMIKDKDKPKPHVMITIMAANHVTIPDGEGTARARIIDDGTGNVAKKFCMSNKTPEGSTVYELKKKLKPKGVNPGLTSLDMPEYGVRIRYAHESPLPSENVEQLKSSISDKTKRKTYRYAQRYSIDCGKVNGTQINVDFTSVKQKPGYSFSGAQIVGMCADKVRDRYEIELELSNPNGIPVEDIEDARGILKEQLRFILTRLQGGITTASQIDLGLALSAYTVMCRGLWEELGEVDVKYPSQSTLAECSSYYLAPAIATLNREHVIKKSLIGKDGIPKYYFTDKADGLRSLLYIDASGQSFLLTKSGILLGKRGENMTKMLNILPTNASASFKGPVEGNDPDVIYGTDATNSVLDGELIEVNDKWYFLAFDIIVKNGINLAGDSYFDNFANRYMLLKKFELNATNVDEPTLQYQFKQFTPYSPDGFNEYIHGIGFNKILDKVTGDIVELKYTRKGLTYSLDGIVFQPAMDSYPALATNWSTVYKYKPMYHLSVDLQLRYDRALPKSNAQTLGMSNVDPEEMYAVFKALYNDKAHLDASPYPCYIKLIDGLPKTEAGEVVNKGDIVECRLIFREGQPFWEPMRVRYDKYKPNSVQVHQNTLNQLYEPVALDNLAKEDGGYGGAKGLGVTDHNRWVSNGFIIKYGLMIRDNIRILDMACGNIKSGTSWIILQNKLNADNRGRTIKIVGIDNCRDKATNIATAYLYMSNINAGKGRNHRPLFSGDSYAFFNENMLTALHKSENTKLRDHVALPESFNIVTCVFAVYYAFKDEASFRTFIANVSRNLKVGGFFICSYMNKEKIMAMKAMKNGTEISGSKNSKTIWKIKRETDVPAGPFGNKIKMSLTGLYNDNEEYFVNLNDPVVIGIMDEYGLTLHKDEPFTTQNKKVELSPDEKTWASFHHNTCFKKLKVGRELDVYDKFFAPAPIAAAASTKTETVPAAAASTKTKVKAKAKVKAKIKPKNPKNP
jgi:hypothetical protein